MNRYKLRINDLVEEDVEYALSQDDTLAATGPPVAVPEWVALPNGDPIVGGRSYYAFWRYQTGDWAEDQVIIKEIDADPQDTDLLIGGLTLAAVPFAGTVTEIAGFETVPLADGTTVRRIVRTPIPTGSGNGGDDTIVLSGIIGADRPQPTVGGESVYFLVDDSSWMVPGMVVSFYDGVTYCGSYRLTTVDNGTFFARNLGSGGNPVPATIPAGAMVVLSAHPAKAGTDGNNGNHGTSAMSRTIADFVQPEVGSTVVVSLDANSWLSANNYVAIGANYYRVGPLFAGSLVLAELKNIGTAGSAAPGTTIPANSLLIPSGPPSGGKGGLISGTDRPTGSVLMPDPNAPFESGPYSFYNANPATTPVADRTVRGMESRYFPELPDHSFWQIQRNNHDNGTSVSGFWGDESWEPLHAEYRAMSLKRWCVDSAWSAFATAYGSNNFTPPPPAPVRVEQLWLGSNQAGYKPLVSLPLSTSGTYDSVEITGTFGPWDAVRKTHIHMTASNRGAVNPTQPTLDVQYKLWGDNIDFAFIWVVMPDYSAQLWTYSPTGVSAASLTITGQQLTYLSPFDALPLADLPDGSETVFDSSDTDTYKPDEWIKTGAVAYINRTLAAERFYGLNPRGIPGDMLARKALMFTVWLPETKEYANLTLAETQVLVGQSASLPIAPTYASQIGTVGVSFSATLAAFTAAAGRTIAGYSANGLPGGITLNGVSRLLSGQPTTAGTYSVTVIATDSAGEFTSASFPFTIQPAPAGGTLALSAPTYVSGTGALHLNVTGGDGTAIEYKVSGLRDWGVSPDFTVPPHQQTGTTFTLEARQSGVSVNRQWTSGAGSGGPTATNRPPYATATGFVAPAAQAGTAYGWDLPGGTFVDDDGDTLTYSATNLPAGLSINAGTGRIGGVPTSAVVNQAVTITASDGRGGQATSSVTFNFTAPAAVSTIRQITPGYNGSDTLILRYENALAGEAIAYRIREISEAFGSLASFVIPANLRSQPLTLDVRQLNTVSAGVWTPPSSVADTAPRVSKVQIRRWYARSGDAAQLNPPTPAYGDGFEMVHFRWKYANLPTGNEGRLKELYDDNPADPSGAGLLSVVPVFNDGEYTHRALRGGNYHEGSGVYTSPRFSRSRYYIGSGGLGASSSDYSVVAPTLVLDFAPGGFVSSDWTTVYENNGTATTTPPLFALLPDDDASFDDETSAVFTQN